MSGLNIYESDKHCHTCLSVGRQLNKLRSLRSAYDMITADSLPRFDSGEFTEPLVCYECAARLRSCLRFKRSVQESQMLLEKYSHSSNILGDQSVMKNVHSYSNLSVTIKNCYDYSFEESTLVKILNEEDCLLKWESCDAPLSESWDGAFVSIVRTEAESSDAVTSECDTRCAVPVTDQKMDIKSKKRDKLKKRYKKKDKVGKEIQIIPEWKCKVCDEKFDTKYRKMYHEKSIHSDPMLCDECGKKFKLKSNLRKHMMKHFGGRVKHPCTVCGKVFPGRAAIKSHMLHVHSDEQPYRCDACSVGFKTETKLRGHLKWSKKHGGVGTERHECDLCNKRFKTKERLGDHLSYQHNGMKLHKCHICSKAISSVSGLRKHVRCVHEGRDAPRSHVCETCGDAFKRLSLLRQHRYIHTGEKPHACTICGARFRQKACLYTHNKRLHQKVTAHVM